MSHQDIGISQEQLVKECLVVYRGKHERYKKVFAVFQHLHLKVGQEASGPDFIKEISGRLYERIRTDWPEGAGSLEVELLQAASAFDPEQHGGELRAAAEWAADMLKQDPPACVEGLPPPAQLYLLCGVYLVRQNPGDTFFASEHSTARCIGYSQGYLNKSIRGVLLARGFLVKDTPHDFAKRQATVYRLFASPDAILSGAVPENVAEPGAAPARSSPHVLDDDGAAPF